MYRVPNEEETSSRIRKEFQEGLDLTDNLLNLAEEILSIEKTPSPKNEKLYIGCQIGLLVSGIRSLYAIRVLSESGMAEDQAMLPLRTLIEITANSVMLNKGNKIKNSETFRDYYLIQEFKLLESASRYSATADGREKWRNLLSERRSEINKIRGCPR